MFIQITGIRRKWRVRHEEAGPFSWIGFVKVCKGLAIYSEVCLSLVSPVFRIVNHQRQRHDFGKEGPLDFAR